MTKTTKVVVNTLRPWPEAFNVLKKVKRRRLPREPVKEPSPPPPADEPSSSTVVASGDSTESFSEPSTGSDVLDYLLYLVWTLLSLAPRKLVNPTHYLVFTAMSVLTTVVTHSPISFVPDLHDVLLASSPPSLEWFKALPAPTYRCWGIYILVLEKDGFETKLYTGSATNQQSGVQLRWNNYDKLHSLPTLVKKAMDNGYTIVHKGLLCWTPTPLPMGRFFTRALFLLLETVFSLIFWTMRSRSKSYGMPPFCPWDIDNLPWGGLCSHAAAAELIRGEQDGLTAEQMARKQAELAARRAEQLKRRRSLRWQRDYASYKATDFAAYLATNRKRAADYRANNPIGKRRSHTKYLHKVQADGKHHCELCQKSFQSLQGLEKHNNGKVHKDRVRGKRRGERPEYMKVWHAENKATKRYFCEVCQLPCSTQADLDRHVEVVKSHHKKAAALKASGASVDGPRVVKSSSKLG